MSGKPHPDASGARSRRLAAVWFADIADFTALSSTNEDLALALVQRLQLRLGEGDRSHLVKPPTEDFDAYDLYLKGRYHWNRRTEDGLERAIECFEESWRAIRRMRSHTRASRTPILSFPTTDTCHRRMGSHGSR